MIVGRRRTITSANSLNAGLQFVDLVHELTWSELNARTSHALHKQLEARGGLLLFTHSPMHRYISS